MSEPVAERIAFLTARFAEDWSAARDRELEQGLNESRGTRDTDAKRELIIFALENAAQIDGEWGDGHDAAEIASGQCEDYGMKAANRVLGPLTAVYSDHPDYQQKWPA